MTDRGGYERYLVDALKAVKDVAEHNLAIPAMAKIHEICAEAITEHAQEEADRRQRRADLRGIWGL